MVIGSENKQETWEVHNIIIIKHTMNVQHELQKTKVFLKLQCYTETDTLQGDTITLTHQ